MLLDEIPGRPVSREWCARYFHLPRRIEPNPTEPGCTRETCLRCGALLKRVTATGLETEVFRRASVWGGEVWGR